MNVGQFLALFCVINVSKHFFVLQLHSVSDGGLVMVVNNFILAVHTLLWL